MRHKLSSRPCDVEDSFVITVCLPPSLPACPPASLFVYLAVPPKTSYYTTTSLKLVTCLPFDIFPVLVKANPL